MEREYETILVDVEGRVATVTLDRPDALNALNSTMAREIAEAGRRLDESPDIGAIVLTGSAKAFAAGADIKEMAGLDYGEMYLRDIFGPLNSLARLRTPVIAAVAGFALGGGCELAMACDIIVAADTARFGQPEVNLGILPGLGGTQRLPRAIGRYKAAEMVLTGRMMDAEEAERSGLVSRVVAADDLLREAHGVAETIASKSLPSVYAAKEALQAAWETTLAEGLRFERQAFAASFALDDQKEGMRAFAEKREPRFEHR